MIGKIIARYFEKVKEELQVPNYQSFLPLWDAFKRQGIPRVQERLAELGAVIVMLPKVMTHLLQPLDVTNNGITNKIKKKEFRNYIASIITKEMLIDSSRDVASVKIYLKLSTLSTPKLSTFIKLSH